MREAAIYARFSSQSQRDASIDDQVRACREGAARRGDRVGEIYADRARSGTTTAGRDEFRRMMEDAGRGAFEVVYVYKLDRFARDRYDFAINRKRLKDRGIALLSVAESVPEGPEGIMLETMLEGMAEYYSANLSQNVRRGMEGNALKCLHNGVRVFGYKVGGDGRYVVDEDEAKVVREVFARRLGGESVNSIARDLAARGYKTRRGYPCNYTMVYGMLRNEKYTGVYVWDKTRVEGGMPQIVDEGTFAMAQRVRGKKQWQSEDWGDFAFAGRAACLECGSRMLGVSGRGRHNKKYEYYRCADRCGCRPVRADWLEGAVVERIRGMLGSRERAVEIARSVAEAFDGGRARDALDEARRSLAEANRGIDNIMHAVEDGMPYADVRERLDELKLQRARAEVDADFWEGEATLDVEGFADFLQTGLTLDGRTLLDAFVWQVRVGTERVVVILNYDRDGTPATCDLSRERFEESSDWRTRQKCRSPGVSGGLLL